MPLIVQAAAPVPVLIVNRFNLSGCPKLLWVGSIDKSGIDEITSNQFVSELIVQYRVLRSAQS